MKLTCNPHGKVMKLLGGCNPGTASGGAGARARSIGARLRVRLGSGQEGQSLVEFAAVLPLLILMVLGMCSISLALIAYQQLGEAVSYATLVVLAPANGTLNGGDPCASVAASVTSQLPSWNASNFHYTVTFWDTSGTAHSSGALAGPSPSCSSIHTDMTSGKAVQVTVTYQYTWFYLRNFDPGNLSRSQTAIVD